MMNVFTLLSIKTRIETIYHKVRMKIRRLVFTLLSIKTRIETRTVVDLKSSQMNVFTLLSIKTRIETSSFACSNSCGRCFYSTIH